VWQLCAHPLYATRKVFAPLTSRACPADDFKYDISKGLRPRRSARTALAHEIMFYAITQKEGARDCV
jgi:hypothetical protein